MADLDAASVQTVKGWFHDHYGPDNAVLVLAGDIDPATARALVSKYFGAIPRGPVSVAPPALVPTLTAPVSETMTDRVAATLISRNWAVPGLNDSDSVALDVAAGVLGGRAIVASVQCVGAKREVAGQRPGRQRLLRTAVPITDAVFAFAGRAADVPGGSERSMSFSGRLPWARRRAPARRSRRSANG